MDSSLLSIAFFIGGFLVGVLMTYGIMGLFNRKNTSTLREALKDSEVQHRGLLDAFSSQLSARLHESSLEVLSKSTDSMMKMAGHQLHGDRELISTELKHSKTDLQRQLDAVNLQLTKVADMVTSSDREKSIQMTKLSSLISTANGQTADLIETTTNLKAILSNSQSRGQLGERIADDILRLAGFLENVNYYKQKALANGLRPDFTFLLPKGLVLNMDVKFPIQNYTKFVEATEKFEREKYSKAFLSDVKNCYKELAERNYHDIPESVDCVLMLIPHEQVFSFIMQADPELFDQALKNRIVTCSPMTLFAVLAVVRKAIDHFAVEKTSQEILEQLAGFRKQWDMFCQKLQLMGKRITDLQGEYDGIINTRTRQLDKQFEKLERIQQDAAVH